MQLTALTSLVLIGNWAECFNSVDLPEVISAFDILRVRLSTVLHVDGAKDAEVLTITPGDWSIIENVP